MNTEEIVIRPVQDEDFPAITEIYNYYVLKGEQSFETEAVTAEEMQQRAFIITIDSHYLVAVSGGTILGFCYAHKWKERAAYSNTLETTIYLSKDARHRGVGKLLMEQHRVPQEPRLHPSLAFPQCRLQAWEVARRRRPGVSTPMNAFLDNAIILYFCQVKFQTLCIRIN